MIHYHGTPVGGTRRGVEEFLHGRAALVPYPRPEDMAIACEVCTSVVIENGAYTFWKQGGSMDVAGFMKFVEEWAWHPTVAWSLIPDVIEGSEADNDAMLADWPKTVFIGVPVWHYHESLDRLERLSHEWQTVALGSSGEWPTPGTRKWWERTDAAMRVVCNKQGKPRCKLHGLRMLSASILKRLPLSSADSTNVVRNGDRVFPAPTRTQRMSVNARRIEHAPRASHYRFQPKQSLLDLTESFAGETNGFKKSSNGFTQSLFGPETTDDDSSAFGGDGD